MRCETFLERYDRLDARSELEPALRRHLVSCASCRATVARLDLALQALSAQRDLRPPALQRVEARVMAAVGLLPQPRRELFSLRDWIIAGVVIVVSMALIPFGEDFGTFIQVVGTSYALPLALVLGVGLTTYSALFVGTHVEEVMSFVRRRIIRQN